MPFGKISLRALLFLWQFVRTLWSSNRWDFLVVTGRPIVDLHLKRLEAMGAAMDGSSMKLATDGKPLSRSKHLHGILLVSVQRSIRFGSSQGWRSSDRKCGSGTWNWCGNLLNNMYSYSWSRYGYHYHWWCSAFAWNETSGHSRSPKQEPCHVLQLLLTCTDHNVL